MIGPEVFKPTTTIGQLIAKDPKRAHAALVRLFEKHGDRRSVARSEDVPDSTVRRWIAQLIDAGLKDPRTKAKGVRAPREGARSPLLVRASERPREVRTELAAVLAPREGEGARQARVRAAEFYGVSEITIRRVAERVGLRKSA